MMKIFYVIKWILRGLLFLLLLDLVVESAVVAPNQKGNQDGTKLSEQRFLPETSPALYVEEENLAPKLNQILGKRVKRQKGRGLSQTSIQGPFCRKFVPIDICGCLSSSQLSPFSMQGVTYFVGGIVRLIAKKTETLSNE
ncbi:unnamed protein product [Clavelina lepadiformis]|uniref:Uncharacterized protein n=1 Tax=Clavelina lepadiformis TaxID=159417 RepID=A0ABP0FRB3_CLALP